MLSPRVGRYRLWRDRAAHPSVLLVRVLIESKAYGATASNITEIIGDLHAIIDAKRHDTMLRFVTEGTIWEARASDLRKIVTRQKEGKIARVYTTKMRDQFIEDLKKLKKEAWR